MHRVIAIVVLVATAGVARADGDSFLFVGAGTAMAHERAGWLARLEWRLDANHTSDERDQPLVGGRIGFDVWGAAGHAGFAIPLGMYFGAQVNSVRTALGGGVGLLALGWEHDDFHFGAAPFASGLLETAIGKTVLGIDARVTRQALLGTTDFTVFSVMFCVGKRDHRTY